MSFRPRRYAHRSLAAELAALLDEHVLLDLRARASGHGLDEADCSLPELAAVWILGGLFVRVLEDRGLLAPRCRDAFASEGELDGHALEAMVATLNEIDERLGTTWWQEGTVAPSAECLEVIGRVLYQTDERSELRWRFEDDDGRVWADVYQHLSEGGVATPEFVAGFLTERALEQAGGRFPLEQARILDPACGAGNLLLAAFHGLFEHDSGRAEQAERLARALGVLDRLAGVDISAPAVVITQFRLLLAVMDVAGIEHLADAPRLPLHVAAGDALLDGERSSGALPGQGKADDIMSRRYQIVLAEPPAVTCRDRSLRERYRQRYRSAASKYSLTAPFIELCLQTAVDGGVVAVFASSSFTTYEFGKALVEDVLARVDLSCVIDLSAAYVPGHGAPFLMLVARNQPPASDNVHVVLSRRGEPITPANPAQGRVWTSILHNSNRIGHDDELISVRSRPRSDFARHPWMMILDEAMQLWNAMNARAERKLGKIASIRQGASTGMDSVYIMPAYAARARGLEPAVLRRAISGESSARWVTGHEHDDSELVALLPYDENGSLLPVDDTQWGKYLWPYRSALQERRGLAEGHAWWQWQRWNPALAATPGWLAVPRIIRYPQFIAIEDSCIPLHTVLSIQMKSATEDSAMFALLAYLNSSVVAFYIMTMASRMASAIHISPMVLDELPVPAALFEPERPATRGLVELGRALHDSVRQARRHQPESVLAAWDGSSRNALLDSLGGAEQRRRAWLRRLVYVQEELDWLVYSMLGITEEPAPEPVRGGRVWPEERPFAWPGDRAPANLPVAIAEPWQQRRHKIRDSAILAMLESSEYKRPWNDIARARSSDDFADRQRRAYGHWLIARIEGMVTDDRGISVRVLVERLGQQPGVNTICELYGSADRISMISELILGAAVPYLAGLSGVDRYAELGMAGQARRERFIIYPGAETDADDTLVFSLASGNHLARARALMELHDRRKDQIAPARRAELLAGVVELLPWLEEWHAHESERFRDVVAREAGALGVSMFELRAWAARQQAKRI